MDRRIQQFHDDDGQTIFAATIQTGGESISLTPANHVIFVNDPLTFQDKRQGIDRVYRWLQTKEVYAYTLVAKDTYDEQVSSLLSEGKIVSELAFDDDPTVQNLSDELIDELLRSYSYSDGVIKQILAFRALSKQPIKDSLTPLVFENRQKNLHIAFENRKLKAVLDLKSTRQQEFDTFDALFEAAKLLTKDSQLLLREFVRGQMEYDINNKVPIKETMLWHFVQVLVPNMLHVDYHGEFEKNIEVGMAILDLLMVNPELRVEELNAHVDDKLSLSKAMDFLDRNNILKIMSLLEILPRQYYYNGQLLFYSPPITVSYRDKELTYRDEDIVDRIAPNRKIERRAGAQGVNFESLSKQFRNLSREEEIRLAIEAHKGNETGAEALLEHNMKLIVKVAGAVLRKIQAQRTGLHFTTDDFEDVYQHVMGKLTKVVSAYGIEANDRTFDKFFGGLIAKTASAYIHHKANLDRTEMLVFDKELQSGSTDTFGDLIEAPPVQVEESPEPKLRLQETLAYGEMVQALKKADLQDWEIEIFTQFVDGGVEGVIETYGQTKAAILDIINEARKVLQGPGVFKKEGEVDEAMISQRGGIDLTSDKVLKIKDDGAGEIKFNIDPAMLQQLQNASGFTPVIINVQPLKDLQLFLGISQKIPSNVSTY